MVYLDASLELSSHGDDSVGHSLDIATELGVQGWVVEDLGGNSSTVGGWVRVHGSDQNLNQEVRSMNTNTFN